MEPGADTHARAEMVAPSPGARTVQITRRALLGDCAPSGRARLDALARWMQDVAFTDVEDAGLAHVAVWVLRRHGLRVLRFPRFGERCVVTTFCSGLGRMWAERRTTVAAADGPGSETLVESVALWVHLDPVRRLPTPLTAAELEVYAPSAAGRRVAARLRHPRPVHVQAEREWRFHRSDADIADHVNNAAYWAALEEELLAGPDEVTAVDAELEFRAPAQPGPARVLVSGNRRWIAAPQGEEVYASVLLRPAR